MTGPGRPSTFGLDRASTVLDAVVREAENRGVAVVAWVVDASGQDATMARMDGCPADALRTARDRACSCVAFGEPTTWWERIVDDDPTFAALERGRRPTPTAGGVPLREGTVLLGGLGVAGAGDEDGPLADAGAAAVSG